MKVPWGTAIKEAIKRLVQKPYTRKYPFEDVEAADGYRGRIEFDISKCIGCSLCALSCPASGAIVMVRDERVKAKTKRRPEFNLSICCFCETCAMVCPTKAIKLTKDYHLVDYKKENIKYLLIGV